MTGDGQLLLVAHPDDDVIGAATVLLDAGARPGKDARVVHLTDGVPADARWRSTTAAEGEDGYRRQRRAEAEAALAEAGLGPSALVALGGRDLASVEEAAGLARAFADLVVRERPARVWTHPYEGGHPDHDAAALVARAALALVPHAPPLWEFTSYHAAADGSLRAGRFLAGSGPAGEERVLTDAEREAKRRLFAAHASQAPVLQQFSIDVERFRPAPRADFSRPPHPGPLLYEVRGWADGVAWRERAISALTRLGLREAP